MKKLIELPPPKEDKDAHLELEKAILDLLKQEIYLPLLAEFGFKSAKKLKNAIHNSIDDVVSAIMSGQIDYYRGKFIGKWDSTLTREMRKLGAVWDRKEACYKLPMAKMPLQLRVAVAQSQSYWEQKMRLIDERMKKTDFDAIVDKLNISKIFDSAMFKYNRNIEKQLKSITVVPVLSQDRKKYLSEVYTETTKLKIKHWAQENVVKLRKEMMTSTFQGQRQESMIKHIQDSYGVAASKAKFLARQETKLLLTSFKEKRMEEAGIKYYAWRCVVGSPGHEVRRRHQQLNDFSEKGLALYKTGKYSLQKLYEMKLIFRYDDPPIVTEPDDKKQIRANPGQHWNCRCFSRSLVEF